MRVLVAAFACRPGGSSETGVGWAVARANARLGHETVLITQPRHRDAIEAALADDEQLARCLRPVYVGLPAGLMETWQAKGGLRGLQLYNLVWQVRLARVARRLHRQTPFDVGHHVTLSTDWIPSGLAWVPDLKVVWGPLGGSERVPVPCRPFLGPRGRVTELARALGTTPMRAVFAGAAARRCSLLLAQNDDEATALRRVGTPVDVRPNVFLEADFAGGDITPPATANTAHHCAVFVGRLLAWKGVHLAVAAMAQPEAAAWTLEFFGDGPERGRLTRSIAERGLQERVSVVGQRPRAEVRTALATADVLFFPSMREAAGWVVAEALAVGCPVVCLRAGGPPLIAGAAGVAVPPGPHLARSLAQSLAAAAQLPRTVVRWDETQLPALLDRWYSTVGARDDLDRSTTTRA